MKLFQKDTFSETETKELGRRLGRCLRRGDVVALTGDLGAGKTHFVMGAAESLGITDHITSPTFTIVNEYRGGEIPLFHFDAYRLGDPEEILEIGYEEYAAEQGVILIEWADRVQPVLPTDALRVRIERQDRRGPDVRRISLEIPEEEDRFADIWS